MKKTTLFFEKLYFTLALVLISILGFSQSQTFTSSDNFTVPAGVTSITVEAWGGGGRGGSATIGGSNQVGGGAGGGAYSKKVITVTPLADYSVVVGSGGTLGTINGGDSWFIDASTILAKGGKGIADNNTIGGIGGIWASGDGDSGNSGGNGANGNLTSYGGGGGSSAGTGTNGIWATAAPGANALAGGGNGGNGATTTPGVGVLGFSPGGGGGGARKGAGSGTPSGGNGANGQVIITWVAPTTYCTPTYTNGPGTVDQITNLTLGTLSNTSGPSTSPFYTFYNAVTIPNLTPSTTASVSLTFGTDPNQYAAVWIDFNQNGTFEASEGVITGRTNGAGPVTINIPVPAGALAGNTMMRIRGGDDYALTTSQACGASGSTYGETEDYIVNIVSLSPPTITSLGAANGCVGTSITINGTNLTGATAANVSVGGTPVSSITSNNGAVIVAVIGAGTTGTVSVTTPGGTATSTASFTVNPLPTVNAGSALTAICQGGTTAALGGAYGGAATSSVWSTTSGGTFANNTGSTPNTTTWTPPAGFSGTATLILTTSGGSCTAATESKTQIVSGTPTVNAGSVLVAICQGGTTVALGGSYTGSATSAIWSTTSGGTFSNNGGTTPNTTTWTPPAGFSGTASLVLTSAGGSCGTASASKNQVVNLAPTVNAGSALTTFCQGGTTAALGGAYGGAATSAIWSTTSGGTFANNTGTTPNTTTWTPPAGFSGTATLILTTSGGSCTAATASKTQIVSGTPTVNAGSVLVAICQGGTTAALGGSYTGSATSAIWSTTSGGTFSNNGGTTPNTTTWTPPAGFSGTASLVLTSAGGSCGIASASKNQVVNLAPTVNAGSALTTFCQGGTTAALGGSYGGAATSATWSTTSGGTFANNTGSTPNTTTWTPPAGFSGTATLILTTSGGSCTAATASKTQIVSGPTVSAGSALATICQGTTTVALGGSYGGSATSAIWSDGGVGGTFTSNTGTTPGTTVWTPPAAYTGTTTLTLTTSGGSCGTTTASKTQVVSNGSFATVGSAITITGSLTSTSLGGNTPSPGSGAWTKISGPSGTVNFSSTTGGSSTATVPTIGTYVFRWTVTSTCGTSYADITVTYVVATASRNYTLFYEDFDATNGGWSNSTSTNGSWLWTDSFPATIAEIGENSFWRLNNYDNYSNNSVIEIDSPVYDFTGYQNLLFNIDVRYDTENNRDGMRILYSINGGAFVQLGTNGTGVNWYNSTSVTALGSNGWSNNSATATLEFTPVGIGANRFLRATTILDDALFKNQSNVKFKVQFKSDGSNTDNGVAFDNVSVEGDAITALAPSPIAPAKINQNLSLWFKSNSGIYATDGAPLTTWEDQAYDTTRADLVNKESVKALVTDAPTFRDNATRNLNFNPVVDFNGANKNYMNGKGGLYSQDYFVVVYSDDLVQNNTGTSGRQIPLGGKSDERSFHEDPTGLGLGNTTARYSTSEVIAHNVGAYAPGAGSPAPGVDSYGRAFSSTTVTYNEPLIINVKTNASGTQTEIYKNGIKVDNLTGKTGTYGTGNELDFYQYKNLPFYLGTGRSGISGRTYSALNGRLSEVVAYTAPNSALDQQKIQSYLGLKYGITLHAAGSTNDSGPSLTTRLNDVNYIDSAENIIWNTMTNTGYNYDVTGIGRDDDSQLYQKQSKTVNTTDDITIGLSSIAATNNLNTNTCDNKHFLVWGNNQGTLAAQPEVKVNMSAGITPALTSEVTFISVGRTWKVVETGGNVPTAKVSIPTSMLSATLTPPGDYLMFISSTTNFDPTAEYRVMTVNGTNLETTYDFDGTKYITFGFAPEKTFVRSIAFDGNNDYLDAGKVLNLNTSFTVSSWIKRNTTNKTILSKRDNAFTTGYDLSINSAGKAEMSWINGTKQTITSTVVIPAGKWHNVAVSYNGTTAKLYIDGVLDLTKTMSTVPANAHSFLIAAADGANPTSFFNGGIDEVRVWNVALTDKQLRYVMNQEILSNGLNTNGNVIPNSITLNDINGIPWSNLSAYYPMSTYTYTNAKDVSNNHYTAALRNLTTVDLQTAPLPYESNANGLWQTPATWLNNSVQDLPNSPSIVDGTTVNWNIVRTNHNITSEGNKTVLALMVNSNTLTASNHTKIEVTNYLKLNGKIDLAGMSQLVQTLNSDLDVTSTGSIERDQQGQANKYNYNYWCSPVSPINTSANNTDYSVAGIMKDGFNTTPREINWIDGYDGIAGNATTPMSIARYWLYKFDKNANEYANWAQITEDSPIRVGQGFTMKGSGNSGTQNITFAGKPNNGLINSNNVGRDQLLLTGNPYSSSLDANAFINDNAGSIDGTLYFWEHYTTNNTHILKDYQGGYAERNYVGGVAPVSPSLISGLGSSTRTPGQFVPVGQGFFVIGNTSSGGTITFNNNQRGFHKETESIISNSLFKTKDGQKNQNLPNNDNDIIDKDLYMKIRLGYNTSNLFHRQVLLGFMNENATNGMDYGYDALNIDDFPSDMYFLAGENQLVIQGVGFFDGNISLPIGVKADTEGKVSFVIDVLENFAPEQAIFIHDNVTDTYHDIRTEKFEVNISAGVDDSRFSLRFKDKTLKVDQNQFSDEIQINHIQKGNIIVINNNLKDTAVEKVELYNVIAQSIASWKIENQDQTNIQIPIKNISAGIYIAKVKTSKGVSSKKIIIN